jgi:xanthine dehydrogenase YagS FAD-binding subunit
MRPFAFEKSDSRDQALRAIGANDASFLAGGTTLVDLMKLDVMQPGALVDINALAKEYGQIRAEPGRLRLGALARMSQAANHPAVARDFPVIAQSLSLAASVPIRNMASLGGNVLQRTRCVFFRDTSYDACNKRDPGSGCAAIGGGNRKLAILGASDACIANYPGDFGVALAALGASVQIEGPDGRRTLAFEDLHRLPGDTPHVETNLKPGELITEFTIATAPWTRRSLYLKVRDRQSYEFAIVSAAVALDIADGVVREARIGLGGIPAKPWRAHEAEAFLKGKQVNEGTARAAAEAALAQAVPQSESAFKPELARSTVARALTTCAAMEI